MFPLKVNFQWLNLFLQGFAYTKWPHLQTLAKLWALVPLRDFRDQTTTIWYHHEAQPCYSGRTHIIGFWFNHGLRIMVEGEGGRQHDTFGTKEGDKQILVLWGDSEDLEQCGLFRIYSMRPPQILISRTLFINIALTTEPGGLDWETEEKQRSWIQWKDNKSLCHEWAEEMNRCRRYLVSKAKCIGWQSEC